MMTVISYEVKVKMMTMTVPQKHCVFSAATPSYAVPDNSKNGTDVFRYRNL
jgi:hypothetical protein